MAETNDVPRKTKEIKGVSGALPGNPRDAVRLAILASHPIQYFVPVYQAIAARSDVDLMVLFRTRTGLEPYFDSEFERWVQWDIPLSGGYSSHFLSEKKALYGIELSIVPWLIRQRPQVLLLHGYGHATNLVALAMAKLLGIKVLLRGDTRVPKRGLPAGWRTAVKRNLFRAFDSFISIGSLNGAYYRALGVPEAKLHFSPFSVQNKRFAVDDELRAKARKELRCHLEVPLEAVVILFSSKLNGQKRPCDLLEAFERVASLLPNAWLWIAGSGPLESSLRQFRMDTRKIRFLGFMNQSELPELYAASDIFVLPSERESWGLVVNEAMAAGLPVVVTDDVGAAPDLVLGKETGYVYPVGDVVTLANILRSLVTSDELRQKLGGNARNLIAKWDCDSSANGIIEAVRATICTPSL